MEGKPLFCTRLAVTLKQVSIGKPIRHHLWSKLHCLIFKYECCWISESVVADSFSKARESACQRYRWVKTQNVSNCNVASGQKSRNYLVFCICEQMDGHVDKCVCISARCISVLLGEIWYAWFTSKLWQIIVPYDDSLTLLVLNLLVLLHVCWLLTGVKVSCQNFNFFHSQFAFPLMQDVRFCKSQTKLLYWVFIRHF